MRLGLVPAVTDRVVGIALERVTDTWVTRPVGSTVNSSCTAQRRETAGKAVLASVARTLAGSRDVWGALAVATGRTRQRMPVVLAAATGSGALVIPAWRAASVAASRPD